MISFFRKLREIFEFRRLKYRFIFFFLIVSLIPTLIIGFSSYKIFRDLIIEREVKDAMINISTLKDDVNSVLSERETIAIKFYIDPSVQNLFAKLEDNNNKFEIMKLLFTSEHMKGNHSIFASDEYGNIYSNVRAVSSTSKSMNYEYNKLFQNNNMDYKWVGLNKIQDEYVLPYVRVIRSLDMKRKLGLVIINMKESTVYNTYKNRLRELDGDIFILDDKGTIISNKNKNYLGLHFEDICKINQTNNSKNSYVEALVDNQKFLMIKVKDNKNNWSYVYLVSLEYMLMGIKSINEITIIICLISALLSLVVGVTIASRITVPINSLISYMNVVDSGNLDLRFNIDRKDEIGKLANFFNKMVRKLKVSIEEIYNVQKAKRDAELKALVFQINPHFLYNTLSSIIWLAHNGEKDKVIELTDALSKLFRISISKGKELIEIRKEIEHVQSYITIQKIRYNNKFICIFDIDDEVLNYYVPKLILQPLVENSLYHGIKNLDNNGIIKIEGKIVNDKIIFNVIDNGNTITQEQVDYFNHVLKNSIKDDDFGIGIKNVNNRIKLFFNGDYGLLFSKKGDKTIASVTIPIIEMDNGCS